MDGDESLGRPRSKVEGGELKFCTRSYKGQVLGLGPLKVAHVEKLLVFATSSWCKLPNRGENKPMLAPAQKPLFAPFAENACGPVQPPEERSPSQPTDGYVSNECQDSSMLNIAK